MRAKTIMLASLAIGGSLSISAQGAADLVSTLANLTEYASNATFEVLLPSAEDPVVYNIYLQSQPSAQTDTLSPCDYVISWETATSSGPISGFSAYYNGNHYRYRNNRLQEYHADASIDPFLPQGPGSKRFGVQSSAQFADLLPQFITERIKEIINDPSYIYTFHPDTIVNKRRAIVIDGVKRGDGYDVMRFSYTFDHDTKMPVETEIESGLGSISEQIMNIYYNDSDREPITITEEGLMETWPEVFEKYRQSTFKAENLVGTPLPAFSCQRLNSDERYTHHSGDTMNSPVIITFLDPQVATFGATVEAIREVADMAPMDVEVLWAFNGNRTEEISQAIGPLREGENTLISASSLIRNCGITLYPTTLIIGRDGNVKEVIPGFNNDLGMVVLQKIAIIK